MTLPVSFRWSEEFVGRIDRARGDVPRSVWVRRAVERALEEWVCSSALGPPAPAEQPRNRGMGFIGDPGGREVAEYPKPLSRAEAFRRMRKQ